MSGENNPLYIPGDILDIIRVKVPAKSLLRFKSVSKSWYYTISHPVFIRDHLLQSKYSSYSEDNHLFVSQLNPGEFSLVKFRDGKFQTIRPLRNPNGLNSVLCYCDGVLLLTDDSNSKFALWNPSTQANTPIYCSDFRSKKDSMSYGICYDRTSDDFKIVGITFWNEEYAVYSCKNKTWTKKKDFKSIGYVVSTSGLYVDGYVYWVMVEDGAEIVYFDPKDDEMKILEMPDGVEGYNRAIYLTCLMGRLCMYYKDDDETDVLIWMRDNNCWKALMAIEDVEDEICPFDIRSFEVMFFAEKKIVISLENSTLLVYDPYENKFEDGDETAVFGSEFAPYVDTLFFPAQNNRFKRKRC